VIVGLLLSTLAAVGVVVAVALPHLREGSRVLTPDGELFARRTADRFRETLGVVRAKVTRSTGAAQDRMSGRYEPTSAETDDAPGRPGETDDVPRVLDLSDEGMPGSSGTDPAVDDGPGAASTRLH
jgi:hypothetical protein